MKTEFVILLFALFVVLFPVALSADVVWLVGEKDPIYGIVESSDANTIRFRQTRDGKKYESVSFDRKSIESVVTNFDALRLAALLPEDWRPWCEYSEELISQKQDPVAHNLAMRLLVIVVGNSSDANQRDAALSDLISLARNADELKRLTQLRYLETGVRPAVQTEAPTTNLKGSNERDAAIELVRAIRNGKDVSELTLDAKLKQTVDSYADVCSWQELVQISKSNRIGEQQLRQLVALEFRLRSDETAIASQEARKVPWHLLASRTEKSLLSFPTIGNVTEFNPNETRFVDGKWSQR
jgi:hypothetical protein